MAGGGFIPLAGGVVPGRQPPVLEGAQFMVPSGAGVTAGSINDGEYNLHLGAGFNTNFSFYRLLGDFDGTHDVTIGDFLTFNSNFNHSVPALFPAN